MSDELPALFHYSATPLGELRQTVQEPREMGEWSFADKPRGLWLSVEGEDDWERWCRVEQFNVDSLAVKHRIVLKDAMKLLWLKTPSAIKVFDRKYGQAHRIMSYPGINWANVASEYSGIVIAPYQWSLRLNLMWYYGWDCASGCIWDTSIIESAEPGECSPLSDATFDRKGEP